MSSAIRAVEREIAKNTDKTPVFSAEASLRFRNLQYAHAKVALEMRALEARHKELITQAEATEKEMSKVLSDYATIEDIDLGKWLLNADTLEFVLRSTSPGGTDPGLPPS